MPELKKYCNHEDVGDCDSESCFGAGVRAAICVTCGNSFDLNKEGRYEYEGSLIYLVCQDCPLPSEYVIPGLNPSLTQLLMVEEGIR